MGNLACGFGAIVFIINNEPAYAAWLVIAAMVFDGLDGQIARLTKTTIAWGAHVDTLADMITFGFVPAFLIGSLGFSTLLLPSGLCVSSLPYVPQLDWQNSNSNQ